MSKGTYLNPKDAVKGFLEARAKDDALFAEMYKKPQKNIDSCWAYIVGVAKKRGNAVCMTDEEVFGLAVHYYCEDDLKENPLPKGVKVDIVASAEEDDDELDQEAVMRIKKEAVEEYKAKMKEMQKKGTVVKSTKKVAEVTAGMGSLFDF